MNKRKLSPSLYLTGTSPAQTGTAAFYALVIVPIAAVLAAVAIDVSAWYSLRDESQQFADRLALQAAAYLPDKRLAAEHINSAIPPPELANATAEPFFPPGGALSIGAAVTLRSRGTITPGLPGFRSDSFSVRREAVAQVVPGDYVFIIADGQTLRPPFASFWGDPELWPASGYFNCASAPVLAGPAAGLPWWRFWKEREFQRWATQACFNPVLSPLKLGVISLLDEVAAAPENRVGMIVTPGDGTTSHFSVLQRLHRDTPLSPVVWTGYVEGERFLGDEVCMLFSEPDSSFTERYALPQMRLNIGEPGIGTCTQPLKMPVCGAPHTPTGHLSRCFIEEMLSLRQAFYWHSARLGEAAKPRYPDLTQALEEAFRQLRDPSHGSEAASLTGGRGNLDRTALRRIIAVSDRLPAPDDGSAAFREFLAALAAEHIELFLIAYSHEGLSSSEKVRLFETSRELAALEPDARALRIFFAGSPEELERNILPYILRVDRQVVLRR